MRRLVGFVTLGLVVLALLAWMVMHDGDRAPETEPKPPTPAVDVVADGDLDRQRVRSGAEASAPAKTGPDPVQPEWTGPVATGRVVDADGTPVEGARIISHPDDVGGALTAELVGAEGSRSFVGTSAEDGTFELPVDPDGVSLVLTASADAGFGQVALTPAALETTIELITWRTLEGRVTDKEDRPIPGATVRVHLLLDALVADRTGVTGDDGKYEIGRLPPIGYSQKFKHVGIGRHGWLIAEAEGFAPVLVECDGPLSKPEEKHTLDITLVRGITLKGKIVDGDTQQPLAGATVVCWSVEGMRGYSSASGVGRGNPVGPRSLAETTSAEDGTYRFEHLPAQGPSGVASHNSGRRGKTLGHVAAWKDGYVYGGDEIPVSPDGATLESIIEMWPLATIEGRVVDASGAPVPDVSVYAAVPDRRPALNGFPDLWESRPEMWVKTDAEGHYVLQTFRASTRGTTAGTLHAGVRVGRTWVASDALEITADAGATIEAPDIVLDLGTTPRAVLIVSDAAGGPIAGATVGTTMGSGRTDKSGRYEWTSQSRSGAAQDPKPAALIVRAPGFAPQRVEFTPTTGAAVEVHVTMEPGRRISGRVATADGRKAEGARVHVVDGNKPVGEVFRDGQMFMAFTLGGRNAPLLHYASSTVAADGTFVVEDLPAGPYHVAAELSSRAPAGPGRPPKVLRDIRTGVAAGADDLVLTIPEDDAPPTHPLEISVTDEAGAPIRKCSAFAEFGGPRLYAQLASPGRLRFAAVPAGEGRITISAGDYRARVLEHVVIDPSLAPEPLTVALDRGVTLSGVVSAVSGELSKDAYVMLRPSLSDGWVGMLTRFIAADGTYEVGGLAPGTYVVTVSEGRGPRNVTTYVPERNGTVTIGDETTVVRDLVVTRAGDVRIHLRDERFAPSPLMGGEGTPEQTRFSKESRIEIIDASGSVLLTFTPVYSGLSHTAALAPGDHVIRLHTPGAEAIDENVTVQAGQSTSATFSRK